MRIVGEQEISIGLLGIGLLSVFVNDDAAVKNSVRFAIKNAIIKLAAAAMRAGMLDVHVVVEMLTPVADE